MLAYYKLLQKTLIACSYDDAFTSEGGTLANDSGGNGEGRDVPWFGIKEQLYRLLSIVKIEFHIVGMIWGTLIKKQEERLENSSGIFSLKDPILILFYHIQLHDLESESGFLAEP